MRQITKITQQNVLNTNIKLPSHQVTHYMNVNECVIINVSGTWQTAKKDSLNDSLKNSFELLCVPVRKQTHYSCVNLKTERFGEKRFFETPSGNPRNDP